MVEQAKANPQSADRVAILQSSLAYQDFLIGKYLFGLPVKRIPGSRAHGRDGRAPDGKIYTYIVIKDVAETVIDLESLASFSTSVKEAMAVVDALFLEVRYERVNSRWVVESVNDHVPEASGGPGELAQTIARVAIYTLMVTNKLDAEFELLSVTSSKPV